MITVKKIINPTYLEQCDRMKYEFETMLMEMREHPDFKTGGQYRIELRWYSNKESEQRSKGRNKSTLAKNRLNLA
jgi:hypothetical protein